jgi:hypothetical protein
MDVLAEIDTFASCGGGAECGLTKRFELCEFDGLALTRCADEESLLLGERHGRGGMAGG